jgi:hypothetical protein
MQKYSKIFIAITAHQKKEVLTMAELKPCPMRHENGNCLPSGGFCTAVNKPICEALHNAYDMAVRNITKG